VRPGKRGGEQRRASNEKPEGLHENRVARHEKARRYALPACLRVQELWRATPPIELGSSNPLVKLFAQFPGDTARLQVDETGVAARWSDDGEDALGAGGVEEDLAFVTGD
jgi:hypothetical protein